MFASPIDVADGAAAGRGVPARGRHQGLVGRSAEHDADDRRSSPAAAGLQFPDRLGRGADADAADRLRRRHQRHQRRRAGDHPQAVRPDAGSATRRSPRAAVPAAAVVRRDALLGRVPRRLPRRSAVARHPDRQRTSAPVAQPTVTAGRAAHELQCLLATAGFADEPVGGCRAQQDVDPDQVARIVQRVVGKLREQQAGS